ncbi:hypothetical protein [Amycolatopsis sp. 195334CR]|uniref:hypothetical protein n=1 Tax=Amycolatopsis sp. 195334CR TaxID=2814588 RepID=UPI001A8C417E|nr:hypothetical protein [Amycolatopsis sp. 195334CR]MBN6039814.1 hypothetical protein [Amycolatopsis sp. 195334CR]
MPSVEEIRARRPLEATVARWFGIGAAVVWVPVIGYLWLQLAVIGLFFYLFGAFGVAKGRQAGRIMSTIGLAVTWFPLLPYCWLGFSDPGPFSTIYAVLDIVAVVISGFSLTLMYHPASNRYIHLVTVARRAELR